MCLIIDKKVIHKEVKKPSALYTRFFPYLSNSFSMYKTISKQIIFCVLFIKKTSFPPLRKGLNIIYYVKDNFYTFYKCPHNVTKVTKNIDKYIKIKVRNDNELVVIDIIDNGQGIKKKEIKSVFRSLYTSLFDF